MLLSIFAGAGLGGVADFFAGAVPFAAGFAFAVAAVACFAGVGGIFIPGMC